MSEAATLTNAIIDFSFRHSAYAWRASSAGIYDQAKHAYRTSAKKGISDILIVKNGRLIAVEVKIGKDRLSPEQEGFLENVRHAGGLTFVAKDMKSFEEWWEKAGL